MTQGSNPAEGFVEQLLAVAGDVDKVRALLRLWAGQRVYITRARLERIEPAAELARRLVSAGVGRSAAVEILAKRRGLSARHARRLVGAAVVMRGQSVSAFVGRMHP